jgi:hypothetical protein
MSYPVDDEGLRRDPQTIEAGAWFYEEHDGLSIIVTPREFSIHLKIPWRKIRASLKRKDRKKK